MAAKGHPNFKSIDTFMPNIESFISWVDFKMKGDLDKTIRFTKRCPPWEKCEWEEKELKELKIELNKIDRFYHLMLDVNDWRNMENHHIFCRMDYKDRHLYFNLQVCEATIYVTFDAEVFLKAIITGAGHLQNIWKSMAEDGLFMEQPSWQDLIDFRHNVRPWGSKGVPTLQFLCHSTVYQNREELKNYAEILPSLLAKGVTQFIRINKTKKHRDLCNVDIQTQNYSDASSDCEFKDDGLDSSSDDEIICDDIFHVHHNYQPENISYDIWLKNFYNELDDEDDARNSDNDEDDDRNSDNDEDDVHDSDNDEDDAHNSDNIEDDAHNSDNDEDDVHNSDNDEDDAHNSDNDDESLD